MDSALRATNNSDVRFENISGFSLEKLYIDFKLL